MKRTRHTEVSVSLSLPTLIAGFAALAAVILLATLPVSCVSGLRGRFRTEPRIGYLATSSTASPQAIQPLGSRPAHLRADPANAVPNQHAITQALWAPGIDHGYVPQGLGFAEGQLLISAYKSTSPVNSMGPCRVYRIDPETGESTGYFDLPPACGHAGGLAYAGNGVLILSDTRRLYRIDLEQALREKHARNAITGTLRLGGALRGSFAAFVPAMTWPGNQSQVQSGNEAATGPANGPGLFIGAWSTSGKKAKGYFLPLGLFDSPDGSTITEENATDSMTIGIRAQGGTFAPDGSLWLSFSSHDFGRIQQVDPATGKVLASYPLVSGTEDLSFDDQGRLWAVSEAGSLRWRNWRTSFPLAFRLDTVLLE